MNNKFTRTMATATLATLIGCASAPETWREPRLVEYNAAKKTAAYEHTGKIKEFGATIITQRERTPWFKEKASKIERAEEIFFLPLNIFVLAVVGAYTPDIYSQQKQYSGITINFEDGTCIYKIYDDANPADKLQAEDDKKLLATARTNGTEIRVSRGTDYNGPRWQNNYDAKSCIEAKTIENAQK